MGGSVSIIAIMICTCFTTERKVVLIMFVHITRNAQCDITEVRRRNFRVNTSIV